MSKRIMIVSADDSIRTRVADMLKNEERIVISWHDRDGGQQHLDKEEFDLVIADEENLLWLQELASKQQRVLLITTAESVAKHRLAKVSLSIKAADFVKCVDLQAAQPLLVTYLNGLENERSWTQRFYSGLTRTVGQGDQLRADGSDPEVPFDTPGRVSDFVHDGLNSTRISIDWDNGKTTHVEGESLRCDTIVRAQRSEVEPQPETTAIETPQIRVDGCTSVEGCGSA